MKTTRKNKGFTLAEVLIVVGIIVVLFAVGAVSVITYLRSMTKLEYDGYAKEIFVAAQNHLSSAKGEDYLQMRDGAKFGIPESAEMAGYQNGAYYFEVTDPQTAYGNNTMLDLMLPAGSVDETIRLGGSYIVRYHKDSGQVLDVFYWKSGSARYAYTYTNSDYPVLLEKREDKNALRSFGSEKSVIGWFGGADAEDLTFGETILPPSIVVKNGDVLSVTVTENNKYSVFHPESGGYSLTLIVKGKQSGALWEMPVTVSAQGESVEIVLDDVTGTAGSGTSQNRHFKNVFSDPERLKQKNFIPGEDLIIQAKASNNSVLTNVAYSPVKITNSLFGDGTAVGLADPNQPNYFVCSADISSARHLENLSKTVSGVDEDPAPGDPELDVTGAIQSSDIDWDAFRRGVSQANEGNLVVTGYSGTALTEKKMYFPVELPNSLKEYKGESFSISNIGAGGENAGLFVKLESVNVSDLALIDFDISGSSFAGALAASATGTTKVSNVIAYCSDASVYSAKQISGKTEAGGLIGRMDGGVIQESAAAVRVSSEGNAGGLIGTSLSGTKVVSCFSGGHTVNGEYSGTDFNVTGNCAGGLVGSMTGGTVAFSYSTCSASGVTAGGLAGTAASTDFAYCYSTGLVKGSSAQGAFAGSLSGCTNEKCKYYMIVNEIEDPSSGICTYLSAVGGGGSDAGITALDADAESYNSFVGAPSGWKAAYAYDGALNTYFHGKYGLNTVAKLVDTAVSENYNSSDAYISNYITSFGPNGFVVSHHGDWPAPETIVINN